MKTRRAANKYTWPICTGVLLIASIFFCFLCYKYAILACGVIIVTSLVIINAMVWLLEIRNIKLEEEETEFIRGEIEKRAHCTIDTDFGNFSDGELVCYDNGLTYEEEDIEFLNFIRYEDITSISLYNDILIIGYKNSVKEFEIQITSDNSLRLKSIFKVLSKHIDESIDNTVL